MIIPYQYVKSGLMVLSLLTVFSGFNASTVKITFKYSSTPAYSTTCSRTYYRAGPHNLESSAVFSSLSCSQAVLGFEGVNCKEGKDQRKTVGKENNFILSNVPSEILCIGILIPGTACYKEQIRDIIVIESKMFSDDCPPSYYTKLRDVSLTENCEINEGLKCETMIFPDLFGKGPGFEIYYLNHALPMIGSSSITLNTAKMLKSMSFTRSNEISLSGNTLSEIRSMSSSSNSELSMTFVKTISAFFENMKTQSESFTKEIANLKDSLNSMSSSLISIAESITKETTIRLSPNTETFFSTKLDQVKPFIVEPNQDENSDCVPRSIKMISFSTDTKDFISSKLDSINRSLYFNKKNKVLNSLLISKTNREENFKKLSLTPPKSNWERSLH